MMKIKIFKVRTHKEFLENDQNVIDQFVADKNIIHVENAFVQEENAWSVCFYYRDKDSSNTFSEVKDSVPQDYTNDAEILSASEIEILNILKIWRTEKAKEQKLPAYCVATNKELFSLAKAKPYSKENLCNIKGFGKHKIENYGEEIISILESV